MVKIEIEKYISQQITADEIINWHGITKENITKYLVEPKITKYINASNGLIGEYWLIFDESPTKTKEGYQIVYDEIENKFGLATKTSMKSKDLGLIIGFNDTFADTLNSI